ncbi:MAG TPA: DNA-directed RNA polymerase subunit omega [Pelagibacteraceae bacterium]|jgi:DNA-directed RNA polymerase subunit omega|nr:DNA-directed RNA polymerase subunit omega [Pelagibacteraceae bacterium]|tara:strand:+ start:80 stop:550 length:471 start_codon:yes stop_codon:yes gene_type:complete
MARITVEDCLEKIDSQYDLVLLAKERALQLNAGEKALVPIDNDKNTVISLREIGDGKISPKIIKDFAINRLRKIKSVPEESEDIEIDQLDDFDKIYKGEISKSGAAILPSKRSRRISEKITSVGDTVVKDDETKEIIEQTDQEAENESTSADNKTE